MKKLTWFRLLKKPIRERVFEFMRYMREQSDRHLAEAQRLLPPHGQHSVGGAEVDERVYGEGIACYLSALDKGPDHAWETCVERMELIIQKHNEKWANDYQVHRWGKHGQDYVMGFHRRILDIAKGEVMTT